MTRTELIAALKGMQAETGSLVCLGCGHENGCSVKGCAIIREAVRFLKFDRDLMKAIIETVADWKGEADVDPQ